MPRFCFAFLCCLYLLTTPVSTRAQENPVAATDMPMDPEAMAQMYASMGAPTNVARMSDSDASCEELYAESEHLQARVAALPKADDPLESSVRMQESIMEAQKKAMIGMRAKSMASSLLGMVPGVGGIAGSLASSAMGRGDGGMGAINEATQDMMKELQESNRSMMAVAQLETRNSHVTQLFLSRSCKVSTLDPTLVSNARRRFQSAGTEPGVGATSPAATDAPASIGADAVPATQ
jgi:hypothetical protein